MPPHAHMASFYQKANSMSTQYNYVFWEKYYIALQQPSIKNKTQPPCPWMARKLACRSQGLG